MPSPKSKRPSLRRALIRWMLQGSEPQDTSNKLDEIRAQLREMNNRLNRMEHFSSGGRSTYMGHGLVLVKAVIQGMQIAYLVEADDRLISPWFIVGGQYETELTDFFVATLRPDDHCLDLGANFGYFTCLFSRFCPQGRVIGVEPDHRIFTILRDNIHINGFTGMASSIEAAVCDTERTLTLHRRMGRSGNTSIIQASRDHTDSLGEAPAQPFTVAGTTVDRLAEQFGGRVDVMKIDTEGAEPLVLRGALRTCDQNPGLQIVMEWSPGQIAGAGFDVGGFLDELLQRGLGFYSLEPGRAVLQRDSLLNLAYTAGILISREPR